MLTWYSSASYSGFWLNLVQLIACISLTLWSFIVSLTLSSLFSPSDENIQLETLGEEFEVAENIWWGGHIKLWVLGQQDALALWGPWPYLSNLICLMIYVVRCFGIVRTIPTSSSSCSLIRCLSPSRMTSLFFSDFDLFSSLKTNTKIGERRKSLERIIGLYTPSDDDRNDASTVRRIRKVNRKTREQCVRLIQMASYMHVHVIERLQWWCL